MAYISYKTAVEIARINDLNKKVIPIEGIEKFSNKQNQEKYRLHHELSRVDQNRSRLERVESYLKNYEKHHAIVEKYENNPFLKGKIAFSKSAKQEYEQAVSACSRYQELIKADGISGKADFHKQVEAFKKAELNVPKLKEQIQATEKGLSVFGAIMNGIEQANKNMQKEQKKQKTKQRYRGQKQNELEM